MPEPVAQRCFHCQKNHPYESMIPGEMLRPAIIETIKKRDSRLGTSMDMICLDCLDVFRSEYVEDALKEEVGELTQLEKEVVESHEGAGNSGRESKPGIRKKRYLRSACRRSRRLLRRQLDIHRLFFAGAGGMDRHQQLRAAFPPL